jgi:hypothetical protein
VTVFGVARGLPCPSESPVFWYEVSKLIGGYSWQE